MTSPERIFSGTNDIMIAKQIREGNFMPNESESTAFDLSVRLTHPELVAWLKEMPEDQITNKVEGTLLAGHFILNLVQASAGEEQMGRFFRPVVEKMDNLKETIERIIRGADKSQRLGEIGEEIVLKQLTSAFPSDIFDLVSQGGHQADIEVLFNSGDLINGLGKAIIEVKLYSGAVPTSELDKFRRDLKSKAVRYGLMVSLSSPLTGINNPLKFEETKDYTAIYVSNSGFDGVNLIAATAMLKAIMLYHARAEAAERISAWAIEQAWQRLSCELDELRNIALEVKEFRGKIRKAHEALNEQIAELADSANRVDIRLQYAVERFSGRLAEELNTLPTTTDHLALPVPTEPSVILTQLVKLEENKDRRAKAFRGIFDIVKKYPNLQIAADEGNNWIIHDNVRNIAQTGGMKTRLDVEFNIFSEGPITINPELETIKDSNKIVVNGSKVEAMLSRVAEHLSNIT